MASQGDQGQRQALLATIGGFETDVLAKIVSLVHAASIVPTVPLGLAHLESPKAALTPSLEKTVSAVLPPMRRAECPEVKSQLSIFVQTSAGTFLTLDNCEPSDQVDKITQRIQDKSGVFALKEHILTVKSLVPGNSKRLDGSRTLADYNIQDKATLQLIPRWGNLMAYPASEQNQPPFVRVPSARAQFPGGCTTPTAPFQIFAKKRKREMEEEERKEAESSSSEEEEALRPRRKRSSVKRGRKCARKESAAVSSRARSKTNAGLGRV